MDVGYVIAFVLGVVAGLVVAVLILSTLMGYGAHIERQDERRLRQAFDELRIGEDE